MAKVRFEIELKSLIGGWQLLSPNGYYYFSENERVQTTTYRIQDARVMVKALRASFLKNWDFYPELRIMKVETVTTCTVSE